MQVVKNALMIYKGQDADLESYSSCYGTRKLHETKLRAELEAAAITDVFVCGLAYDYCVGR